jgi:caffeoyl-CoA O-methyltransferase
MSVLPDALSHYLDGLAGPESGLLAEVEAYTHSHFEGGAHMLSGRMQGRLLAWISKLVRPKHIVEIGTFTGYSALCLAEGLALDGQLHTVDRDARLQTGVQGFFERSPWAGQMHLHIGSADPWIATLKTPIDLAFVDADKRAYGTYLEALLPLCRPGAVLLFDNVLWKGRVYDTAAEPDAIGQYLINFNKQLAADPRLDAVMLPVRDGLWAVRVR